MVVDRLAGGRGKDEIQLAEARGERGGVGRRQRRKALDARRERLTRTVQAPSKRLCLCGPSGLRSRRRRSSHRRLGISVFRGESGSRSGFPVPLAGPVTRATPVRMTDATTPSGPRQRSYPRTAGARQRLWITEAGRLSRNRRDGRATDSSPLGCYAGRTSWVVRLGRLGRSSATRRRPGSGASPTMAFALRDRPSIARSTARSSSPTSSAARVRSSAAAITAGSVAAGPGRTRMKAEPDPGTDATSRSPPIRRARSRAIGRPRPVPVMRS